MKTKTLFLSLISAALLAGCATAPTVTGSAVQIVACELAKAKPAAKAPLHSAGLILKAFGGQVPPTQAEMEAALASIPKLALSEQIEVDAAWALVCAAYGLVYNATDTPEEKVRLQLWLTTIGTALDNGSTCGAASVPPGVAAQMKASQLVTWDQLAEAVKRSLP